MAGPAPSPLFAAAVHATTLATVAGNDAARLEAVLGTSPRSPASGFAVHALVGP